MCTHALRPLAAPHSSCFPAKHDVTVLPQPSFTAIAGQISPFWGSHLQPDRWHPGFFTRTGVVILCAHAIEHIFKASSVCLGPNLEERPSPFASSDYLRAKFPLSNVVFLYFYALSIHYSEFLACTFRVLHSFKSTVCIRLSISVARLLEHPWG